MPHTFVFASTALFSCRDMAVHTFRKFARIRKARLDHFTIDRL